MAIAFDAVSASQGGGGTVSSLTFSHTCSGANRILTSGLAVAGTGGLPTATYNGVALTRIDAAVEGTTTVSFLDRLVAPATGANNVVWTLGAARRIAGGAMSYTGVDQTTPLGTVALASGTDATPTVNVSSASGEVVIDAAAKRNSTEVLTVDGSQTQRYNQVTTNATAANNVIGAGSEEAGAATVTMSWSMATARSWAIVGVSLKPAAGGPTEADGSTTGVGTASGVAASVFAGIVAAIGAGVASGVAAATVAGAGVADGTAVASATSASTANASGTAAGVGTASGSGATIVAAVGSSAGVGTASGEGEEASTQSDGNAAGIGTATGASATLSVAVAASAGTGTATGATGVVVAAVGSSSGVGAATAEGAIASGEVDGAAAGTGTATGVGIAIFAVVGSSTGVGTVTGIPVGVVWPRLRKPQVVALSKRHEVYADNG